MGRARRPWWNPFACRGVASSGHRDAGGEQSESLTDSVQQLRTLLKTERTRLRPDTWQRASRIAERTAELLPHWTELTEGRAAEALVVEDVVCRHLPRRLEAFLAVPDSQKPTAAPELLEQLEQLEQSHLKAVRRLHAVSRIRLESLRALRQDN